MRFDLKYIHLLYVTIGPCLRQHRVAATSHLIDCEPRGLCPRDGQAQRPAVRTGQRHALGEQSRLAERARLVPPDVLCGPFA
jgi:hypothetical protein